MYKNVCRKILASLLAAALLSCPSGLMAADDCRDDERVTVILSLSDGASTASMRSMIKAMDGGAEFMDDFSNILHGFSVETTEAVAKRLMSFNDVEDVYISRVFEEDSEEESESDGAEETVALLNEGWEYRGEGMIAAVIDSSFDTNHEMFTLTNDSTAVLEKSDIDAMLDKGSLTISNYAQYTGTKTPYVSPKIPYAFDYCGYDYNVSDDERHGTHVAGIIGANNKDNLKMGFDGVAPECQLLLMKASHDDKDGLYEYAIMYAIDDAITLGANVINMSFSTPAGSADHGLSTYDYGKFIDEATAKGIVVVCSAGNENMLGMASNYDKLYGIDMPMCDNPDYGLVGSPSTYLSSFSVAAVDSPNVIVNDYIITSSGAIFGYQLPSIGVQLDKLTEKLEYVAVPGLGEKSDYSGLDVKGKVALVSRGELSFIEKVKNAQSAGAVGVIIYNTETGADFMMQLDSSCTIPAVSVTYKSGMKLKQETVKTLSFKANQKAIYTSDTGGQISGFSSRGMTASLTLKPEITAMGGDVYSTIPNGYAVMSGTSMASPYTAGAALLVMQSIMERGEPVDSSVRVRRILMSSAATITDASTGVEYSPRTQGAGLVDIDAALNCGVTAYASDSLTKIELGDKLGRSFSMSFNLRNDTDRDISYKVNASVTSDTGEKLKCGSEYEYFITGGQTAFNHAVIKLVGSDMDINKYKSDRTADITVKAGEIITLTVKVEIERSEFARQQKIFTNGFFAEGYIWLTPTSSDEITVSIPYAGFCGDWEQAPVFSGDVNSDTGSFYTQYAYSYFYVYGSSLAYNLGQNLYLNDDIVNPELVLISPNGDNRGDYLSLRLYPLRNISELSMYITSEDGERVSYSSDEKFTSKSSFNSQSGSVLGYNLQYIWNGSDFFNTDYRMPDGKYTLTVEAKIDDGDEIQYWSMDFGVDTVKPTLDGAYITVKDGRTLLHAKVSDDHALQYVGAYLGDTDYGESFKPAALKAEQSNEVVIDITEAVGEKYIYLDIMDFALNLTTEKLVIADIIRK